MEGFFTGCAAHTLQFTDAEMAAKRAEWAAQDNAIAQLPVKQTCNGYDICHDGTNYVLRCPSTKQALYTGKLSRCRQVAKE